MDKTGGAAFPQRGLSAGMTLFDYVAVKTFTEMMGSVNFVEDDAGNIALASLQFAKTFMEARDKFLKEEKKDD